MSLRVQAGRPPPQFKGIKIGRQSSWCGVRQGERETSKYFAASRNSKRAPPAPHISASSLPGMLRCPQPPAKSSLRPSLLLSVRHRDFERLLGNSHRWQHQVSGHAEHPAASREHFSSPQSFFAERLFALFDSDGSGTISLEELLSALSLLVHGSETDKLRFLFRVYDVDGKMIKKKTISYFLNTVMICRAARLFGHPGTGRAAAFWELWWEMVLVVPHTLHLVLVSSPLLGQAQLEKRVAGSVQQELAPH